MKQNISYRRAGGLMAAALGLAMLAGGALAQPAGDAKNSKKIFNKCKSCHVLTAKNTKKTGPTLYGVFGRKAGSTDFKYGKSIVAAGEAGLIWDEAKIFAYVMDPKVFLGAQLGISKSKVKNKMTVKLKDPQQRADVIAYIRQETQK
jgi:cytochrome c